MRTREIPRESGQTPTDQLAACAANAVEKKFVPDCARETLELRGPGLVATHRADRLLSRLAVSSSLEIENLTHFLVRTNPYGLISDPGNVEAAYRVISASLFHKAFDYNGDRDKIREILFSFELYASSFPPNFFNQLVHRLATNAKL